jgi:beta-glucanase (GH16 family)
MKNLILFVFTNIVLYTSIPAQEADKFSADFRTPPVIPGMKLVWHDEFNINGKPDSLAWRFESGFVRNNELQWYQPRNAYCKNGLLVIEGRKEKIKNPMYIPGSQDWRLSREYAQYSSSSIQTQGFRQWQYGRFEIRARIDTAHGAWPAIWTLGIDQEWPSNGEIDIMEFYRINNIPTILANFAWGTDKRFTAKWKSTKKPLSDFTLFDAEWISEFHIWRMDWTKDSIELYLDGKLLNSVLLTETENPDGFNPFNQPHYILLNLAIGENGGNPERSAFPIRYEVDYIRIYQAR